LISGPTSLEAPNACSALTFARRMKLLRAVNENFEHATIAIFAAAVADYRPAKKFRSEDQAREGISNDNALAESGYPRDRCEE